MLHEGAGSSVMAAYVEIVFDNSDGRLSVETEEVVLRRTVGLKKDEFFLNRKRVQKSEVYSLLESAGFSKSNPYYIVQQGKVSNLCVMKDKDRLNLLKEIAGTTVYEERRQESLQILQEANGKQDQITEVLTFIEERLSELEQEKQELTEYEQLDKNRRALEFTIYDHDLSKASEKLAQIEVVREEERNRQAALQDSYSEIQETRQAKEEELSGLQAVLSRLIAKLNEKAGEFKSTLAAKASIVADISDAQRSAEMRDEEEAQLITALQDVRSMIDSAEQELKLVEPEFNSKNEVLTKLRDDYDQVHARVEMLYGKQGRGRQFTTKTERDNFLQGQIDTLQAQIESNEAFLVQLNRDVAMQGQVHRNDSVYLSQVDSDLKVKRSRLDELSTLLRDKCALRNDLQEQRKICWRENDQFQEQISETKQDLEKGKQQLVAALPKAISQGLSEVERIVEEKGITGYYGPLIDNFTLKSAAFQTAVEVAAGNALFHVIVDSDQTAAVLIKELDRRKAGRLTFLPLNRLRIAPITYPDSRDVRPLIDVAISYDKTFEQAMRQVFGKKLLARDLAVAAHFSAEYDLDAITKDGDIVNHKGGFEGGFRDDRYSRVGAVLKTREAANKLGQLSEQESDLIQRVNELESAINEACREVQKLEMEKERLRIDIDDNRKEHFNRSSQHSLLSKSIAAKQGDVIDLQKAVNLTRTQVAAYRDEMRTQLLSKLSESEKDELRVLTERERSMQTELETLQFQFLSVSESQAQLQANLKENLLKRRDELEARLTSLATSRDSATETSNEEPSGELTALITQRDFLLRSIQALDSEIKQAESAVTERKQAISALDKELDSLRQSEENGRDELKDAAVRLDKLLNKRTMLIDTIQQKQRQIRDLGALPRKEVTSYNELSEKQLLGHLKEVNEKLKVFGSVNKKALDQYVSFSEQRDSLISRREELTRDNSAIETLIQSLDAQKDEAILRTFRGVSQHFAAVFSELVPNGQGQLVMKTAIDGEDGEDESVLLGENESLDIDQNDDDDEDDEDRDDDDDSESPKKRQQTRKSAKGKKNDKNTKSKATAGKKGGKKQITGPSFSSFVGVQVRVSFTGTGQLYDMQQLSGGQKALVALALIFAIQRCDPAPFYLFDEIDQALDANYRKGVARLIQKQVESIEAPAQFITTTFRPELVSVANKCYGIALLNKVSNIYPLDKTDAQNFITSLMNEDEALGHVTTVPNFSSKERSRTDAIAEDDEEEESEENSDISINTEGDDDKRKRKVAVKTKSKSVKGGKGGSRFKGKKTGEDDDEEEGPDDELNEEEEALIAEGLADLAVLDQSTTVTVARGDKEVQPSSE